MAGMNGLRFLAALSLFFINATVARFTRSEGLLGFSAIVCLGSFYLMLWEFGRVWDRET